MNEQNQSVIKCSKCGGEMEQGVNTCHGSVWVNKEVGNLYKKLTAGVSKVLNTAKTAKYVTTFRCVSCGYLEKYAK